MVDSYTPKYVVVKNFIIDKIETGVLKPGDRIPSENELAKMFNVSRVTINAAITQLGMQNVVDRVKGKGTFVKKPEHIFNMAEESNIHSFKISSRGHSDDHELMRTEVLTAGEGEDIQLVLLPGERCHKITRLMSANSKVIAVDYSYFPFSFYPRDPVDTEAVERHYLHVFLQEFCGKSPKRLSTTIGITMPDEVQRHYLKAGADEPLLLWNTSVIDHDDQVLGYTATCARPEDFQPYLNFLL